MCNIFVFAVPICVIVELFTTPECGCWNIPIARVAPRKIILLYILLRRNEILFWESLLSVIPYIGVLEMWGSLSLQPWSNFTVSIFWPSSKLCIDHRTKVLSVSVALHWHDTYCFSRAHKLCSLFYISILRTRFGKCDFLMFTVCEVCFIIIEMLILSEVHITV